MICYPVHIYSLHINSILLIHNIMVMIIILPKSMLIFLTCTVHEGGPWQLPRLLFVGGYYQVYQESLD